MIDCAVVYSRIPFMEKLFYNLSNNLLQFCLETCKVQSKSCSIISKLRSYDLSIVLGEGRSRTTIRAPARQPGGGARANSTHAPRPGEVGTSAVRRPPTETTASLGSSLKVVSSYLVE